MRTVLAFGVTFFAVFLALAPTVLRAQANTNGTTYVRPPFVSGEVVLSDGSPLPGPVPIERICGIHVYRETFTDAHGVFGVELGQNQQAFTDASTDTPNKVNLDTGRSDSDGTADSVAQAQAQLRKATNNPNASNPALANILAQPTPNVLADCELRASLPGYHSQSIMLATRRGMDTADVGTIVLTYMGESKGSTLSVTSALAPRNAEKAFDKGVDLNHEGKYDQAQKELLKAVQIYPKFAEAWFELGSAYERGSKIPEAKDAYGRSVAVDPNFTQPYERLYLLASREQKWQEVAANTQQVLRLSPFQFPAAYYYDAVANLQLGNLDTAEKSARGATKLTGKKADPRSYYVLGLILGKKGDLAGAAEALQDFLENDTSGANKESAQRLLADAQAKLAGH